MKKQFGFATLFVIVTLALFVGGSLLYDKYNHDKERDEIVDTVLRDYAE